MYAGKSPNLTFTYCFIQDRNRKRKDQRHTAKYLKQQLEDEEIERLATQPPAALLCAASNATLQSTPSFQENGPQDDYSTVPTQPSPSCDNVYTATVFGNEGDQDTHDAHLDPLQPADYMDYDCDAGSDDDDQDASASDSSCDSPQEEEEGPDITELYRLLQEVDKCEQDPDEELSSLLAQWTLRNNVTHSHVDELLSILRGQGHPQLKKNIKTILKTPRKVTDLVRILGKGAFYYHGLLQALIPYLSENLCASLIELDIFSDGFSPYNSVKRSVWPIIGSIVGSEVPILFIIALWCGAGKDPGNINEFLKDFVAETKQMMQGFSWNGKQFKIKIRHYIGDAPARSFLRGVLVHNSYGSCERCTSYGQWQGRVVFRYNAHAEPRTDETFASRLHAAYHTDDSPLEELGTGMISQFPLDVMHLIYLGVMKRLLSMLLAKKKASIHKLSDQKVSELSDLMELYSPYCPSEFSRKPRSLSEWKYYKAHELRRILLYDGILIYKALNNKTVENNFLLLHCALRILSDIRKREYFDDADVLLKKFVQTAEGRDLYGPTFSVYNVHHTTHLADECKRCDAAIHDFSAFKYENFLGSLKPLLKAPGRTLPQLIARIIERARNLKMKPNPQVGFKQELSGSHGLGPLCGLKGQQFRKLVMNGVQFKASSLNDSCCVLKDGDIVVIENVVQKSSSEVYIVGKKYHKKTNMYTYPLDSSLLGIFKVSRPMPSSFWNIQQIDQKMMRLPISEGQLATDSFVCIPMFQHFDI